MSVRKFLLALTALGVLATVPFATADTDIGVATQFAGTVTATTSVDLWSDRAHSEEITGTCKYIGVTTLSGGIQFTFAGATASYSTSLSQPLVTVTQCRLVSPAQGLPGERPTMSVSFGNGVACPGAACATASTTGEWPLRPVLICVSGFAVFGPTPAVQANLAETCRSS